MNENENKSENKSVIRKNWTAIVFMLAWLINMMWGMYGMMDGNYKESSSYFLSSNMFAMLYITFFTKYNAL